MYRTGVIGDADSINGFACVGFDIFPVDDSKRAGTILRNMAENGYGVIYITEALASQLTEELERYSEEKLPAIIPIPGMKGNTGIGMKSVSKFVEKAVGSDIIG